MRWPKQVGCDTDVDGLPARQCQNRQHALGAHVVSGEDLAHEGRGKAFFDVGRPAAVVCDDVACPEELAVLGRCGAESRDAGSAARDVEDPFARPDDPIPDAPPVARVLADTVGMLNLEVPRRDIGMGQPIALRGEMVVGLVPFVDDDEAERLEERALEVGIESIGRSSARSPIWRASSKLK